ncbi:hypothetical protein STEG23_017399, partial [Scotinomys teguina]
MDEKDSFKSSLKSQRGQLHEVDDITAIFNLARWSQVTESSNHNGGIPNSSSVHYEGSGYEKWPSTASESCQKCQRIQNHMSELKNSPWITWFRPPAPARLSAMEQTVSDATKRFQVRQRRHTSRFEIWFRDPIDPELPESVRKEVHRLYCEKHRQGEAFLAQVENNTHLWVETLIVRRSKLSRTRVRSQACLVLLNLAFSGIRPWLRKELIVLNLKKDIKREGIDLNGGEKRMNVCNRKAERAEKKIYLTYQTAPVSTLAHALSYPLLCCLSVLTISGFTVGSGTVHGEGPGSIRFE